MANKDSSVPFETQFDMRLLEKKIEHGFLTREEVEKFLKNLPEEKELAFTSAEELDKEQPVQD